MANTVYPNFVLESKVKDLLLTSLNTRSLMTLDTELSATAGMNKTINTYTYDGAAEEVKIGKGNTERGSITYVPKDYEVKMVQQAFDYFDEDFMKDNTIVDSMLKGASQTMTNKMTADFIAACKEATLTHTVDVLSYDNIVDAVSVMNIEDESALFLVIPNAWKAELRKDEDYKAARMGEVVYTGQVGTICGIPVIATKALEDAARQAEKDAAALEKFRQKYEKRKAKEDAKAAKKAAKKAASRNK
jgi:hypothetical protein